MQATVHLLVPRAARIVTHNVDEVYIVDSDYIVVYSAYYVVIVYMETGMNAFRSNQRIRTMGRAVLATLVAFGLTSTAPSTHASVLDTRTLHQVESADLYDTYHDVPTGFVFVKLPTGWRFVGADLEGRSHEVFLDPPTGFVFIKTSAGWRFVAPTKN